jgi:hypothetical protein
MPHYRVTESGLMIPVVDSSQGEPRFKCTVITGVDDGENRYCGKAFHDPHSFERHTIRCSEEHMGAIREAAPSQRLGALSPQNQTDWEDWLDAEDASGTSNRRKVIEGRKKF